MISALQGHLDDEMNDAGAGLTPLSSQQAGDPERREIDLMTQDVGALSNQETTTKMSPSQPAPLGNDEELQNQQTPHLATSSGDDSTSDKQCCRGMGKSLSSIFERPFQVRVSKSEEINPEATGWCMDTAARGPLNATGSFVGTALLRLALDDAGCSIEDSNESNRSCENEVYGLNPSSLLTATASIYVVVAALLMPFIGSVVDYTRYRRLVGAVSAAFVLMTTAAQISLSERNWFIMLCLETFGGFMLLVHVAAVLAYLPDLSSKESDLIIYTSGFNIRMFITQTIYVLLVVLASATRRPPDATNESLVQSSVTTARFSAAVSFVISGSLMLYSWAFLFEQRPALAQVPQGRSLFTAGFSQLYETYRRVSRDFHALKWFLLSLLWSPEGGSGVIQTIAVTFIAVHLQLSALGVSIVFLLQLAAQVPGSMISRFMCRALNPLQSYRLAQMMFALAIALSSIFLTDEERATPWVYICAFSWGVCLGWIYPSQRVLFCTLIPKGHEMEFMGIFTFFGNVLSWLPPLLFTTLNERGISMRWGLGVIPIFLVFAFLWTLPIGNYGKAVAQVQDVASKTASDEGQSSSLTFEDDAGGGAGYGTSMIQGYHRNATYDDHIKNERESK